jgi:hypothetical protein
LEFADHPGADRNAEQVVHPPAGEAHRDLDDLVDPGGGVVAGERAVAVAAGRWPQRDNLVRRQGRPERLHVPGLAPLPLPLGTRAGAGMAFGGSLDGGPDELADVRFSRPSRAAIRDSSPAITAATTARDARRDSAQRSAGIDDGRVLTGSKSNPIRLVNSNWRQECERLQLPRPRLRFQA